MSRHNPVSAREFAVLVVERLRAAGFEALWAGGCVRDQLLGREPKDYDVATSAEPEQIREVFGHRQTEPIGAAFGVITVLGPRQAGPIEVATFRKDAGYSDGRRPDSVSFSNAEEDACRRDFTINGLFFDPQSERVIDYVGGQEDLQNKLIRAIGSAADRIAEDKLRMLRAVRFATTLQFEIQPQTLESIRAHAAEIDVVSAERIGAEMRRVLTSNPARGLKLLQESCLLQELAPPLTEDKVDRSGLLLGLGKLESPAFSTALAVALWHVEVPEDAVAQLSQRWRLTNLEQKETGRILNGLSILLDAPQRPWPQVQRVLAVDIDHSLAALQATEAVAAGRGDAQTSVIYCRHQMTPPREQWDPAPLITGGDLRDMGLPPGPSFRELLRAVRDEQLDGRLATKQQAIELALHLQQRINNAD